MGLTEKREAIVKRMPIIKTDVLRSKDGKYLIHRTTITHIKPMSYYQAIVNNAEDVQKIDELDLATALASA